MSQEFLNNGYEVVNHEEKADVYVVNTCTVTNIADRKSRQMLRRVKEINSASILVACGCYVQVGREELGKMKEIDLIIGNNEKKDIVKLVEKYIANKANLKDIKPNTEPNIKSNTKQNIKSENEIQECEYVSDVMHQKEFVEFGPTTYTEKTRAVIKIQDGCDRFCSYCIIPYARGRVRSRKLENVITEVEQIVQKGIKEIVITGIHIASYGKDFKEDIGLIDLLEKLNEIHGLKRIRLGSIEPKIITEEFVNRLSKLEKICDHFHLSLQSGCDETLKRMNRRYTTEEFKNGTKLLREKFPNAALTTDVIVGFPAETEEEFNITYEFLKEIKFYKMHVFKYSQRKGTKAAVMPNQIDGSIKEERSKKLLELSDENELWYNSQYIGKTVEVLFEEKDNGYFKGHTTNYIEVWVEADKLINDTKIDNTIQNVEIVQAEKNRIIGKL